MTNRYSQLLTIAWRALLAVVLIVSLNACGSGDEVSGIDGSGQKVDPVVAPNEPEVPQIPPPVDPEPPEEPEPPVEPEPPRPDATIAVEGTINGFGSVIVHGERYDTSRARFYRNGMLASERDFEVGDMVALLGFREDGKLYARDVYFTPALSGRVESFDEQKGTLKLFGQTVTLDADTVIGADLDSAALWGETITISGWQSDGQVRATRVSISPNVKTAVVRGNISSIDGDGRAYVGDIWVDLSALVDAPALDQGDLSYFEGEVIYPENNGPRYLLASRAERVANTLAANQTAIESITAAGILRNIAQNTYFTINDVQVNIGPATQSLTPTIALSELRAGQLVVVQGEPSGNRQINAHTIKVLELERKEPFSGVIEDVTVSSVTVGGMSFDITAATALVDIQQAHSRITPADLRVGEYVVLSAIHYGSGYEALSVKRTAQGLNDFKYDGTDKVLYDWGFPIDVADAGPSKLYSARVHAAHPSSLELEIGPWNRTDAEMGQMLRVQIKHPSVGASFGELNFTEVYNDAGESGGLAGAAAVTEDIFNHLSEGRLVWVSFQASTLPYGRLAVEKLHVMVDREGRHITAKEITAEEAGM